MIKLENVSKIYSKNKVRALDNISLVLPETGFVAVIGESGSGKSTLLNMIGGLDTLTDGDIIYGIDGKSMSVRNPRAIKYLRKNVLSYVLQENVFIDELTISDNIRLSSLFSLQELPGDEYDSRYKSVVHEVKLEDRVHHYPIEVSGGQKQRATLVRGLMKHSRVILADEPTASQDEESELTLFNILRKQAMTQLVVLVTHSKSLAYRFCDRVICLDSGKILFDSEINHEEAAGLDISDDVIDIRNIAVSGADDWEKIKEQLIICGSLKLRLVNSEIRQNKAADTSFKWQEDVKIKSKASKAAGLILPRLIGKNILKIIAFSLILTSLLSLIGIAVSTDSFDSVSATNTVFIDNGEKRISMYSDQVPSVIDISYGSSVKEKAADYIDMAEEYFGTCFDRLCNVSIPVKGLEYQPSPTAVYAFSGFLISDFSGIELSYGSFPEDCRVLVSDFFADGLIAQSDNYSSYSDVVSNGIALDGITLGVSGIFKTDYRDYLSVLSESSPDEDELKLKTEFMYKESEFYLRILISGNYYEKSLRTRKEAFLAFGDSYLAFVSSDENLPKLEEGTLYVNSAFAEQFGNVQQMDIFGNNRLLAIIDEDKDTNPAQPTVYLNLSDFDAYSICMLTISGTVYHVSENEETLRFFTEMGFRHYSSLSTSINDLCDFVKLVKEFSIEIKVTLIMLLLLFIFLIPSMFGRSLRKSVALCRVFGADFTKIFLIESAFIISFFTIAAVIFVPVNIGVNALISAPISLTFSMKVNPLFSFSPTFVVAGIATGFAVSVLFSIIMSVIRYNKKILYQLYG